MKHHHASLNERIRWWGVVFATATVFLASANPHATATDVPKPRPDAALRAGAGDRFGPVQAAGRRWLHLSTRNGDLPEPTASRQQTAVVVADLDRDGLNDFVLGFRETGPALVWYRRTKTGWDRYVIEKEYLTIEAGGAVSDIDGDGYPDLVFGGDWQSNKVWWWRNPGKDWRPDVPWERHTIKKIGATQHHDQCFADLKGTGKPQLAYWNQGAKTLLVAEIPPNPREADHWSAEQVFSGSAGENPGRYAEGMSACDVDSDGRPELLAGNYMFRYQAKGKWSATKIGDIGGLIFAGRFIKEAKVPQIVIAPGDGSGPVKWYECQGNPLEAKSWRGHDLVGRTLIHPHSLQVADIDGDGNLDIFVAEMAKWSESKKDPDNPKAQAFIFYGDGKGGFRRTVFQTGMGFHEARVADLNGDGKPDILSKPYNWDTPRVDVWLNQGPVRTTVKAAEPVYPVKVSPNGRYFVDQKGNPVFWLGTTQWQLFREYNLEDARTIVEKTKAKGFAFAQVMLMGVGDGTKPNVYGEKPWRDNNPLTPNEGYFKNVDAVVRIAHENNLVISMTLYHQRYRKYITIDNARAWARWIATRYRDVPTIVWSMTPEARQEFVPVLRELAAGLREGDGGAHLITFKPDPAPYSSSFIHGEPWLDFDSMQTWNGVQLIYPMVAKDYGLRPIKPVLMAEGAYEHGSEYGFEVTPLWIRRQAYYSYLAGAHHTYGHNDSWRVLPTWKQALDAPGATQLGILKKIFLDRKEWWRLVPDQDVFASSGNTAGKVLKLAARHEKGRWVMIYLGSKASFSVRMDKAAGPQVEASWIDPRTGQSLAVGRFASAGTRSFSTPDGWEDALLVLESVE